MDINQAIETLDTFVSDSLDALDWSNQDLGKAEKAWALVKRKAVALEKLKESITQRIEEDSKYGYIRRS